MGINDVTDAFDGWLETVTGSRGSGSYVNGRWVAGTPTALSFSGVVQNANPKDLEVLPEGNRDDEAIKIHTVFELETDDTITYKGLTWLVFNVAKRYIGNYNKVIAVKQ